jgi:EmrB/QacA subfamily drug resistance transporter
MSNAERTRSLHKGHPGVTLFAMCLTAGMTFLEVTASIGTLTALGNDLMVPPSALVWVVSAYTLPVAALILTASTLGSLFGRKRMLAVGVVVLAAGSLVVATAPTLAVVLAGQAVAGVGAALVLPNSVALITVTFTEPHERTRAIGLWAASSGVGLATGPVIAGVLLEHYDWHAVFLTNVVLGAVALVVTLPCVVESRQRGQRLDPAGLLLGTLTVSGVVYGAIEGGRRGYSAPVVVAAFVVAAVAAVLFVVVELRVPDPMIHVRLFGSASFSAVMAVAAVGLFGFTGVTLLVVLYFQRVMGLSQLSTGVRLLPEMVAFIAASTVTATLVRRVGFTTPLVVGLTFSAAASLAMLTAGPDSGYAALGLPLAVFGAGVGFVVAASTAAALTGVALAQAAMVSGLVNTFRQVGAVLGTAVLGTILTSGAASSLPHALSVRGVGGSPAGEVVEAFRQGTLHLLSAPVPVRDAVRDSLTSGVHTGLVVNAGLFFAAAVLAALAVRHPHTTNRAVTAGGRTGAQGDRAYHQAMFPFRSTNP